MTVRQKLGRLAAAGAVLMFAMAAYTCLNGCGGATAQQQVQEADWTALDAFCIKNNATRGAIDACRDGLRVAFCAPDGGIFSDAGACVHVTLSTGNRP